MEKKKDLRVQKTYSALMAAFEALMAEETFDDITVNELCARALIRRPTFYSHFEDKYDFLRFYLNEIQWQIESEADAATDSPVEHFQRSWRALIAFIDEHPALIRMGLRSKSLPIIFEIISEHVFASSSRRVRAYCGAVTDSPALADTLATFTVGGLIQNLKRYLTEPNLDPDALTAEMTTVFEHLWNSFTSEARGKRHEDPAGGARRPCCCSRSARTARPCTRPSCRARTTVSSSRSMTTSCCCASRRCSGARRPAASAAAT